MAVDRDFIERTNFSIVRDGYDPVEVRDHLRYLAQTLETLTQTRNGSVGQTIGERVQAIFDKADQDALALRKQAEQAAVSVKENAQRSADQAIHEAVARRESARRLEPQIKASLQPAQQELRMLRRRTAASERQVEELAQEFAPVFSSAKDLGEQMQGLNKGLAAVTEIYVSQLRRLVENAEND
jgi:chromosome segregation ATPase